MYSWIEFCGYLWVALNYLIWPSRTLADKCKKLQFRQWKQQDRLGLFSMGHVVLYSNLRYQTLCTDTKDVHIPEVHRPDMMLCVAPASWLAVALQDHGVVQWKTWLVDGGPGSLYSHLSSAWLVRPTAGVVMMNHLLLTTTDKILRIYNFI